MIGTTSTANVDFVRSLGAETVVDYTSTQVEQVVHDVDLVVDTVGGQTLESAWPVIKRGGTLVSTAGQPNRGHPVVYSCFAESAGEAVEDRLHHVLEKRTLSGLDVNVGWHPGRRDEFRHVLENLVLF